MAIYTNRPELKGQPGYIYIPDAPRGDDFKPGPSAPSMNDDEFSRYLDQRYGPVSTPAPSATKPASTSMVPINTSNYTPYGAVNPVTPAAQKSGITFGQQPSGGGASSSTSTQTSTWKPSGPAPEMPNLGTPTVPEWDEKQISKNAQRLAAPDIRRLRTAVQTAAGAYYDNPMVRKITLREALAGYGQGLENVLAGSHKAAVAEYGPQWQAQTQAANIGWQVNAQALMTRYQNLFTQYTQSGTRTTETSAGPTRSIAEQMAAREKEFQSIKYGG